jgi:hypothetical protein
MPQTVSFVHELIAGKSCVCLAVEARSRRLLLVLPAVKCSWVTMTGTVGGVLGITIVYPLDTAKMRSVRRRKSWSPLLLVTGPYSLHDCNDVQAPNLSTI